MRALRGILIVLVILLALGLGAVTGGYYWYRTNHIKVNGTVYAKDVDMVDLRGAKVSVEEYEDLRKLLPAAVIRWDVPFQDGYVADDTQELTILSLTREDLERLQYLPQVTKIHARQCREYALLEELEAQRPDCQVDFDIRLGEETLERNTESLSVQSDTVDAQQLRKALPYLHSLTAVELENPTIPAGELYALQEEYPEIVFTWTKEFMGKTYGTDVTELDFSNTELGDLRAVEDTMAYFPNLQKLILVECGFDYEDLAAYRDRVRDRYKVVWGVHIGRGYLRTDATSYMPSTMHKQIYDEDTYNLRYCEDLIAVDFGHINVGETSWCVGTPHLKYLILGDGNVFNKHMVPLSCLKELEFVEIFNSPVTDISPLVECTGIRDLLLSGSHIDIEPLTKMTWLENLWLLNSSVDWGEAELLREKLPNTHIEVAGTKHGHSRGWRDLPRYFEMRDAFGMPYMTG